MPIRALPRKPLLRGLCLAGLAALVLQTTQATAADPELERYKTAERIASEHLAKFDTLDFEVFTHQKWERFRRAMPRISSCTGLMDVRLKASTRISRI